MKSLQKYYISFFVVLCLFSGGCGNSSGAVWEDAKTIGRYLHRKGRLLWREDVDSRLIANADEFTGPSEEEFIPLRDEDLKTQFANLSIPQPKESPGTEGSSIPSIDHFKEPTADLAQLFQNIYFNTDEHVLSKNEYYHLIGQMADYMKENPNMYVFVSGHCDERASEAYNLALGTRRANTIRRLLVRKGVNPNHIYTISFGKEMPVALGHTKDAWAKNRRVEFKIFRKE